MENKRTTIYITAKNRIGCRAPTALNDLDFIMPDFGVFSMFGFFSLEPG
jgi:hypothetical protein